MKKFTMIGLVVILLAFSAIPVLAAGPNGHGHGNGGGQGNGVGNQNSQLDKNQNQPGNHGRGARNQAGGMRQPFYLQGTITAVDAGAKTVTIRVFHGNARVKQFIGTDLVVNASTSMFFEVKQGEDTEGTGDMAPSFSPANDESDTGKISIDFGHLAVNDIVAVHGNVVAGVYTATVITVYDRTLAGLPEVETP